MTPSGSLCPHCGAPVRADAADCEHCGVDFAKWRKKQEARPAAPAAAGLLAGIPKSVLYLAGAAAVFGILCAIPFRDQLPYSERVDAIQRWWFPLNALNAVLYMGESVIYGITGKGVFQFSGVIGTECAVLLGFLRYFLGRRSYAGACFILFWFGTACYNESFFMADARDRYLLNVLYEGGFSGPGGRDWSILLYGAGLGRWCVGLGQALFAFGCGLMAFAVLGWAWLAKRFFAPGALTLACLWAAAGRADCAPMSKTFTGYVSAGAEAVSVSEDGYHYAVLTTEGREEVWSVDGKTAYRGPVGSLTFHRHTGRSLEAAWSPLRGRFAFVLRDKGAREGRSSFSVWVDGSTSPAHEEVYELAFSPDGGHLAYSVRDQDGWRVVLDGVQQSMTFRDWRPQDLRVSAQGGLEFLANEGSSVLRVRDGAAVSSWPAHGQSLTPDARHVVRRHGAGERLGVFLDEKPLGPACASVSGLTLAPGRTGFFCGRSAAGPFDAIVDGRKAGPPVADIQDPLQPAFFFPAQGSGAAWFGKRGDQWSLFWNGAAEGEFAGVASRPGAAFSPSGRHRAYAVRDAARTIRLIVDGRAVPGSPVSLLSGSGVRFDGEDEYHFFEKDAFGGVFLVCASRKPGGDAPRCRATARRLAATP